MIFPKAFHLAILTLCGTSFGALVASEGLPLAATLLGALVFLLVPMRQRLSRFLPSHRVWTYLTLAVFVACAYAVFFVDVINGIAFFFIYLQFQKLLSPTKGRDYLQLIAISFFQMVGAASMTVSLPFAVFFLVYMILAVASLTMLTCQRDADRAALAAGFPTGSGSRAFLSQSAVGLPNLRHLGGICAATLCMVVVLFLYIPRLSATNFFLVFQKQPRDLLSGFSDEMSFGDLEPIRMDSTVVMRVLMRSGTRPPSLRLRGVALSQFDGSRWSKSDLLGDAAYPSNSFDEIEQRFSLRRHRYLHAKQGMGLQSYQALVQLEPRGTRYLFMPEVAKWLQVPPGIWFRLNQVNSSISLAGFPATKVDYMVGWENWNVTPAQVEAIGRQLAAESVPSEEEGEWGRRVAELRATNTALPTNLATNEALRLMADEQSAGGEGALGKARALVQWFHRDFLYTTTPPEVPPDQHVELFLTANRQGHCEFFASALAVLLRLEGIPARVVNGYYTDDYNEYGEYFVVRQEHAHAWVEVFDDGLGWVTFDATPPSGVGSGRIERGAIARQWSSLVDWVKLRWYENVVDYSFTSQRGLYMRTNEVVQSAREVMTDTAGDLRDGPGGILLGLAMATAVVVFWWMPRRRTAGAGRTARVGDSGRTLWQTCRRDLARILQLGDRAMTLTDRELSVLASETKYRAIEVSEAVRHRELSYFGGSTQVAVPSPAARLRRLLQRDRCLPRFWLRWFWPRLFTGR